MPAQKPTGPVIHESVLPYTGNRLRWPAGLTHLPQAPARPAMPTQASVAGKKSIIAIGLCAALAACGGGDVEPPSLISSAKAQTAPVAQLEHLHAILRPDANGRWYVQTDQGPRQDPDHSSYGISWEVEQTSEYVRIFFFRNYTHAGSIQISSDDDFASRVKGYSNLGLNSATIRIEVDGRRIDPGRILEYVPTAAQAGNLWINVTMVVKK